MSEPRYLALKDHFIDRYVMAGETITLPPGVKPGEHLVQVGNDGQPVRGAYEATAKERVNTQADEVLRLAREEAARILSAAATEANDIRFREADQRDLRVEQSRIEDQVARLAPREAVEVAAVAPHAPNPTAPQGLPSSSGVSDQSDPTVYVGEGAAPGAPGLAVTGAGVAVPATASTDATDPLNEKTKAELREDIEAAGKEQPPATASKADLIAVLRG